MSTEIHNKPHDTIFQTFDRYMEHPTVGYVYMGQKSFEGTVEQWNGVPIIFANEHPVQSDFDKDPEAELKRINGKIVGKANNVRIEKTGHPKLRGDMLWDDKEFELPDGTTVNPSDLNQKGELSLSTGFRSSLTDDNKTTTPVTPHHILLFKETISEPPVDKGSMILNKGRTFKRSKAEFKTAIAAWEDIAKETGLTPEDVTSGPHTADQWIFVEKETIENKALATKLVKLLNEAEDTKTLIFKSQRADPHANHHPPNITIQDATTSIQNQGSVTIPTEEEVIKIMAENENLRKKVEELEAKLAENETESEKGSEELTQKDEAIKKLKETIEENEKKTLEQKWLNFKDKVPEGFLTEENEKENKELFFKAPTDLAEKVLTFKVDQPGGTDASGKKHTSGKGGSEGASSGVTNWDSTLNDNQGGWEE